VALCTGILQEAQSKGAGIQGGGARRAAPGAELLEANQPAGVEEDGAARSQPPRGGGAEGGGGPRALHGRPVLDVN